MKHITLENCLLTGFLCSIFLFIAFAIYIRDFESPPEHVYSRWNSCKTNFDCPDCIYSGVIYLSKCVHNTCRLCVTEFLPPT